MRKIGQIFRFLIPVIALVALVVFMTGAGRRERARLEKNKALIMRYDEEFWNKGDMAVADEIVATDYVRHHSAAPKGILRGREALKEWVTGLRNAWPDFHCTAEDVIAEGDKVVVRYAIRATFKRELAGIPPTGKELTFESLLIHRIAGGKVVEDWVFDQELAMMYQMGMKLVPAK